jgi:hypothetical protein
MDGIRAGAQNSAFPGPQMAAGKKEESTAACDKVEIKGESDPQPKPKKWLFLTYTSGDNNLQPDMIRSVMMQSQVGSDANTDLVSMLDIGPEPQGYDAIPLNGDSKWKGARTLYLTKNDDPQALNAQVLKDNGDVDMSDPATLTQFATSAIKQFPADHIALVFADHGAGYHGSIQDEHEGQGRLMSLPDIKKAIKDVEDATGKKIDIIGFNACLMGEAEVAYQFKDEAHYLLASEEVEYSPGWQYNNMLSRSIADSIGQVQRNLKNKLTASPEDFARAVVDTCKQNQDTIATFSATDLTKMDNLRDSIDGLGKAILNAKDQQALRSALGEADHYYDSTLKDTFDIADRLGKLSKDPDVKKSCEAVKQSIQDAVIANENEPESHPGSHGLSINAPRGGSISYDYPELDFAKDTCWPAVLKSLRP